MIDVVKDFLAFISLAGFSVSAVFWIEILSKIT